LTDGFCHPLAFLLTGGQVADCIAADTLLDLMPATTLLHGDKGYDSDAVRRKIGSMGVAPNIPPKANPTASLILLDRRLPHLSATRTSRQRVHQTPREADTQRCD
jgi:IS5 family transposase